jgi:ATP-dependent DNA ligase
MEGEKAFRATNAVFDAEIVSLDGTGKPIFKKVINRLMSSGDANIQKLSKTTPCFCYIFDCLYLDGRPLVNEPLTKRKIWLKDAVRSDTPYRVSEFVEDGDSLFEAAREHNLEGIMAKKRDSKYTPGKRTDCWYKIKIRQTCEVFVIGYTKGKGDRGITFGALHIAEKVGEELHYRGKVGTGFDDATIKDIIASIEKVGTIKKPDVTGNVFDPKISVWLAPKLVVEVAYSKLTPDKMFRESVFIKLRLDMSEV